MYDRDPYVDRRDFPGIVNPTPRVAELREVHEIETIRGPGGIARYRLRLDAERPLATTGPEQQLLLVPPATSAIHGWPPA